MLGILGKKWVTNKFEENCVPNLLTSYIAFNTVFSVYLISVTHLYRLHSSVAVQILHMYFYNCLHSLCFALKALFV